MMMSQTLGNMPGGGRRRLSALVTACLPIVVVRRRYKLVRLIAALVPLHDHDLDQHTLLAITA
jgi:hypothetical protein